MRVVFLDIDGVMNNTTSKTYVFQDCEKYGLDNTNVENLNILLDHFDDLYIVISSNWRKYPVDKILVDHNGNQFKSQIQKLYKIFGDRIIDLCPCKYGIKSQDIMLYLNTLSKGVYDFIIFDDDPTQQLQYFGEQWIRTDNKFGLTKDDVKKAIQYFENY